MHATICKSAKPNGPIMAVIIYQPALADRLFPVSLPIDGSNLDIKLKHNNENTDC